MKPLHFGLLLVGTVLVGGLAVKLTQAPPIPVAAPATKPASSVNPPAVSPAVVKTRKPSPTPTIPPLPLRTTAPEPVFDPEPQPAIRKNKPILIAQAKPALEPMPAPQKPAQQVKPTQWTPGRYETAGQPVAAQSVAAKPVINKPAPSMPDLPKPEPPRTGANVPRHVTLQPGMTIPIRLDQLLNGDSFQASLAEPLAVDGLVIAEKGARVNVRPGLASLLTSDGQRVAISTDPGTKPAQPSPGAVVRFRVASRITITERNIAGQ
jgi:hypothetical protein